MCKNEYIRYVIDKNSVLLCWIQMGIPCLWNPSSLQQLNALKGFFSLSSIFFNPVSMQLA